MISEVDSFDTETDMPKRCRETNADGKPCKMPPLEGKDTCWTHTPELAQARERARQKGGRNTRAPKWSPGDGSPPQYRTVDAIQGLLELAIADTLLLANTEGRSRTVGSLAGQLLGCLEVGELEERLKTLEELIQKGRRVA